MIEPLPLQNKGKSKQTHPTHPSFSSKIFKNNIKRPYHRNRLKYIHLCYPIIRPFQPIKLHTECYSRVSPAPPPNHNFHPSNYPLPTPSSHRTNQEKESRNPIPTQNHTYILRARKKKANRTPLRVYTYKTQTTLLLLLTNFMKPLPSVPAKTKPQSADIIYKHPYRTQWRNPRHTSHPTHNKD